MNSQIKRLSAALTLMILALMVALTYHQFFDAPNLNANDLNRRVTDAYWEKERGKMVTIDGSVILAESVPIGTETNRKFQRSYPQGAKYAHLTGYFPAAVHGQVTELEKEAGPVLSGRSDALWLQRLQDLFIGSQPQAGNVSLTLNSRVQDAMANGLDGKVGAAVALNPKTGEILGMYSAPSFDPNALSSTDPKQVTATYDALIKDPNRPLLNRAISELYPPGSTFKIITTSALLNGGTVNPSSVVDAPDQLDLPNTDHKLINYAGESCGNGRVPLHYAFAKSCNTPFAKLGMELGAQALADQTKAFGFGQTPRIPMVGTASEFPMPTEPSFLANAAIGQQSVRVTPLQMAMVAAAIANEGKVMRPYLINQELSSDYQVVKQFQPKEIGQATSAQTAAAIRDMMIEVVQNGTGTRAQLPGINVAGKTGTAETGTGNGKNQWFVGFAPAENPVIALAIVLEDPQGIGGTGGSAAAPLARNILTAGVNP